MKKYSGIIGFLLIVWAIYWGFESATPAYSPDISIEDSEFSTDRALHHVKSISEKPHAVGFPAHEEVKEYIVYELEKLGLKTEIQSGYTAGDHGNYSKAINILARIEGSGNGKALLLLSHYDSSPHSSYGASDAGSGVATILEAVRAFLSQNPKPVNDVIILISDAEELGLNGADLFVNKHPWAKEVGLVLNLEARGSGGPSYMLMETNQGNARLIEHFIKADPEFPVTNSLAYSVYKMLPNDTDLTVFREDGDIQGFNFAFIDDHYDYHTALDNFERLDRNTLAHQGSYIMPLLKYFSNADLNDLRSQDDYVYFDLPFYKLVSYPFSWIWPMYIIALLLFVALIIYGLKEKKLTPLGMLKGLIPAVIVVLVNGIIGFYGWSLIVMIFPEYGDMLHGFTYNGNNYIAAFVLLSLTVCFFTYHKFRQMSVADLMAGPILIWLIICWAAGTYLPGASFFTVTVLAFLASFMIVIYQEEPSPFPLIILALPAIWILGPFIHMFPVGLGLKMIITVTLLTSLGFFFLFGIVGFYKRKLKIAGLSLLLCSWFFFSGFLNSDFDKESPKPTSLLYVKNLDEDSALWATYEDVLSDWTAQYIGEDKADPAEKLGKTISSKYSTGFSFVHEAPVKPIPEPMIEKMLDTVIDGSRVLEICIMPQRNINRLEVFSNEIDISSASINGIDLRPNYLSNRRGGRLVTHYVSDNDFTELRLSIPQNEDLELTFYEASNDLLEHPQFTIPARPENAIPMPFVLNDAVLQVKKIRF